MEAYYREKFVPELKQSVASEVPPAEVAAKIRELLTEEKVNELMVSWLQSLRSESKVNVPGSRVGLGRSPVSVTEPAARPRRWWKYLLIACGIVVTALPGCALVYHHRFFSGLRPAAAWSAEVERITGGRAEIGSFHVVPFHLQVEVRNITVHGKEAANDVPLAHADSLLAQVKVISFLRTEFGFSVCGSGSSGGAHCHCAGWNHQYSRTQVYAKGIGRTRRSSSCLPFPSTT